MVKFIDFLFLASPPSFPGKVAPPFSVSAHPCSSFAMRYAPCSVPRGYMISSTPGLSLWLPYSFLGVFK